MYTEASKLIAILTMLIVSAVPASIAIGQSTPEEQEKPTPKVKNVKPSSFIRYEPGRKISRLETALVTYQNEEETLEVTLVAAVHIGDAAYFRTLQKRLAGYDLVLYEGLKRDPEEPEDSMLTLLDRLQWQLKDYLALSHQRGALDVDQKNFRRADLSTKAVKAGLEDAGVELVPAAGLVKSMGPLFARALKMLEPKGDDEPSRLLRKVRDGAKKSLARVLGGGGEYYERFKRKEEQKRDEVIIAARNRHALKMLQESVAKGEAKKIAILYGAGHMTDFEQRLRAAYPTLSLRKSEWLAAWTIGQAAKKAPEKADPAPKKKPKEL